MLFSQGLWRIFGGFWWGLPWIYRLLLVELPFWLCWSCQSMSMGDSSHFLVSSWISFFNALKFLSNRSFTSLVRDTPRYFLLFVAIVNGDVSLISFSASLFFVYRRATDYFESILYPATSLNVLISCSSSLEEILGSLMYTIISSANNESLNSSFLIWILLISICCLIAISRTSSTILKRYEESGQLLLPDFSVMAFSFSLFNLMLAVGLLYIAFIILRYP